MNILFDAVEKETEPMFDTCVITESGVEYWNSGKGNNANNGHSTTKLIMATAVGILCDRGQLSLDTPVTGLFSDEQKPEKMSPYWDKVTVRHVLQHKIGYETVPYGVDDDDGIEKIGPDFLKYVFTHEVEFEPGTHYRYSDSAYYLVSRIIAAASGMTAEQFICENITKPLGFRQWATAKCPAGHMIGGGGFFARSDDTAKVGYLYAGRGVYDGKRIISEDWINAAMQNDYACTRFRDTDVFVKTGAHGQMIAFSQERLAAASWHGFSMSDGNNRNNRLLEAFVAQLDSITE